jgi:hypothetical protein
VERSKERFPDFDSDRRASSLYDHQRPCESSLALA